MAASGEAPATVRARASLAAGSKAAVGKPVALEVRLVPKAGTRGRTRSWRRVVRLGSGFRPVHVLAKIPPGRVAKVSLARRGRRADVVVRQVEAVSLSSESSSIAISNGSFESGLDGWTSIGRASLGRVRTSVAPDGRFVARSTLRRERQYGMVSRRILTTSGGPAHYTLGAMVAGGAGAIGDEVTARLVARDDDGAILGSWSSATRLDDDFAPIFVRSGELAAGAHMEVQVFSSGHRKRDAFLVDAVTATRSDAAAETPTAPPSSGGDDPASPPSSGADDPAPPPSSGGDDPAPPPSGGDDPAPPPPSSSGDVQFDGWTLEQAAGASFGSSAGSWGNYLTADIRSGASGVTLNDGGGLYPGKTYLRLDLPSNVERAELREPDWGSTSGQRDPAHTQANGSTSYVAFAFRFPVAPKTGGWGFLVMQMKSLISNSHDVPPQVSLINTGSGSGLTLRIAGGQYSSPTWNSRHALTIEPGTWYRGILGIKLATDSTGFAKLWMAPAGQSLPAEGSPTVSMTNIPTNYADGSKTEPGLWSVGPYHSTAGSGRDLRFDTIGFSRASTYATAQSRFAAYGG